MKMGHCKDCKHAVDQSWREPGALKCSRMDASNLVWIDGDASDACILVSADFGCVQFEAKPQ